MNELEIVHQVDAAGLKCTSVCKNFQGTECLNNSYEDYILKKKIDLNTQKAQNIKNKNKNDNFANKDDLIQVTN